MPRAGAVGGFVLAALAPSMALAHHSYAMFDTTKTVTVDGEVETFEWANPHVELTVLVPTRGAPERWRVELSSPGNLKRQRWTPESLKPGDKVHLRLYPAQDSNRAGAFESGRNLTTGVALKGGQLSELGCN